MILINVVLHHLIIKIIYKFKDSLNSSKSISVPISESLSDEYSLSSTNDTFFFILFFFFF